MSMYYMRAVVVTDNYASDEYIVYNAYETRMTQSCNTAVKGCCSSGTVLTQLVQDMSTPYACYAPVDTFNDMAMQARARLIWLCPLRALLGALACCMHRHLGGVLTGCYRYLRPKILCLACVFMGHAEFVGGRQGLVRLPERVRTGPGKA